MNQQFPIRTLDNRFFGIGRRPFGYGFHRPRPYLGYGFGGPFVGGVLGGLLGSALLNPYLYYPPYGYGYGFGYPGGFWW